MIVDNSIVVMNSYIDKKDHGISSWHAAKKCPWIMVTPIITATMAFVCIYSSWIMLPGTPGDFVRDLPMMTICIALVVSVLVALLLFLFLISFHQKGLKVPNEGRKKNIFRLDAKNIRQNPGKTFKTTKITIGLGVGGHIRYSFYLKSRSTIVSRSWKKSICRGSVSWSGNFKYFSKKWWIHWKLHWKR